jgi:diadenylate cyclase
MHFPDIHLFKFGFFDVLDIVIVAVIIYQVYNLIRGTIAANIFIGLALICVLYFVVDKLEMPLLTTILKNISAGDKALFVVGR